MKKLFLAMILFLTMTGLAFGANSQTGNVGGSTATAHYEGVSVDTDPGANGFWSEPVAAEWGRDGKIFLEITAVNGTTFTLKFHAQGMTADTYATYDTYDAVGNYKIDSNPGTQWIIGIEDNNQGTAGAAQLSW